ncbi:hypothetical protein TNCV_3469411 [Trichonephila clavipes]|nr:hypothetical protein TNCV_3469411 [Trichonephila clavipes]
MVLKDTANNRRHLALSMMNFVGLDLAFTDQVAFVTTHYSGQVQRINCNSTSKFSHHVSLNLEVQMKFTGSRRFSANPHSIIIFGYIQTGRKLQSSYW